MSDRWRISN
jgi:hypothetical protein